MTDLTKIEKPFGLLDEETQDALRALPEGAVQNFCGTGLWGNCLFPKWFETTVYRQQPIPALVVPDAVWSVLPPKYKWAAGDFDGVVYVYATQPKLNIICWSREQIDFLVGVTFDKARWTESLIQRPDGV